MGRRLLLLTHHFRPDIGGLAASAGRIARSVAAVGIDVDVLAWTRRLPAGRLTTDQEDGLTVHRLGTFANWDATMQHTTTVVDWLLRSRQVGAVWGHYLQPAGFFAVVTARRLGLPAAVSVRGDDFDAAVYPPGDFARLLWTLQQADVVTTASRDLAHKVDTLLGQSTALALPNTVDAAVFTPGPPDPALREALGIGSEEQVLGFSGELRHKKGAAFVLDALVHVRRSRPACLLVIGEIRAREQSQLALLGSQRPEDAARVIVTGHLSQPAEVARHLRLVDVYLQPSLWDGLPNALLEAMACARCVLASDAGGMPEVITSGVDGFVLERHLLNHLGAAALEVLDLPAEQRLAIGQAARQRVLETFHLAAERRRLDEVLARLGLASTSPAYAATSAS
jgi:phosphatidyl-myo-inositol dimannoside synthase